MTPEEKEQILTWGNNHEAPIRIHLALDGSDAGKRLADFCDRLVTLSPGISIKNDDEKDGAGAWIRVRENIRFQAVPEGKMLPLFLAAISATDHEEKPAPKAFPELVSRIKIPFLVKVYVAPQCPFCPQVLAVLMDLALASRQVHLTVIDASLFPDKAAGDKIRSVPTTILDGQFRWSGVFSLEEMVEMGLSRDSSKISADALRKMLEAGDAEQAAGMMAESQKIFPALFDLLAHEKWPVRLGAMVAVEYLADTDPALADALAVPLWQRFRDLPEAVKGDVVHVFGLLQRHVVEEYLHQILEEADTADLIEATKDALESLN